MPPPPPGLPTRTRSSWSTPGPLTSCSAVEAPTLPVPPRITTRFLVPPAGGGGRASEEGAAAALAAVVVVVAEAKRRAPTGSGDSSRRCCCGFELLTAVDLLIGLSPTATARPLLRIAASAGIGREVEASISTDSRNGVAFICLSLSSSETRNFSSLFFPRLFARDKRSQAGGRTSSRFRRGSKEDRPSRRCDARGGRSCCGGDARRRRRRRRRRKWCRRRRSIDSSKHRRRQRRSCFLLNYDRGSPAPAGSHPRCGGRVVRLRRRREPVRRRQGEEGEARYGFFASIPSPFFFLSFLSPWRSL